MMRRAVLLIIVLAVVGCRTGRSSAHSTIRLAIHRDPVAFLPIRAAASLGYFEQEGVAVDVSEVTGGAKAMEALLGGSVDAAAAAMSDVLQLAAGGRQLRAFLLLATRPTMALAVAPARRGAIRTPADLKGRIVGVSAPGSATHQFLEYLLSTNGIASADVGVVSVGMAASSVAALERGTVDAAVLLSSAIVTLEQRDSGLLIADTRTAAGARRVLGSDVFPSLGIVAAEEWLDRNADSVARFVRALRRAMLWVKAQTPDRLEALIPPEGRLTPESAELAAIRQAQDVLSIDGVVTQEGMAAVQKFVATSNESVRRAHLDMSAAFTNRFVLGQ